MKVKEVPRFLWKNPLYLAPGYGTYKEFQKPKEERKRRTLAGWGVYALWWAMRINYVGIGLVTGNWAPNNFKEYVRNDKEIAFEIKNKQKNNNLEKTIEFEVSKTSQK